MDNHYIHKVLKGDSSAFTYFIQQYKDMAFTLAMSVVKDAFVAEEVVHDAFLKAFHSLAKFQMRSRFSTWFYRIVINEALKREKKEIKWKNRTSEINEETLAQLEQNLSSQAIEQRQTYICEVLDKMPPKESLALRLFYLNSYNIEEITELTGWSVANVKVILHRARKTFYSTMKNLIGDEIYQLL